MSLPFKMITTTFTALGATLLSLSVFAASTPQAQPVPIVTESTVAKPAPITVSPKTINPLITQRLIETKYNPSYYELTYQTFKADHDSKYAYEVAFSAARQSPNSLVWHQRLAQGATKYKHPYLALQQWLYVYRHGHSSTAFLQGLKIAKASNDHLMMNELLAAKIQQGNYSNEEWEAYISTLKKRRFARYCRG